MLTGAFVASTILVIDATMSARRLQALQDGLNINFENLQFLLLSPIRFCHRYMLVFTLLIVFVDKLVSERH